MATPGQQVAGSQQQNAPQQHPQQQGQEADPIVQFKELIPRLKISLVVRIVFYILWIIYSCLS